MLSCDCFNIVAFTQLPIRIINSIINFNKIHASTIAAAAAATTNKKNNKSICILATLKTLHSVFFFLIHVIFFLLLESRTIVISEKKKICCALFKIYTTYVFSLKQKTRNLYVEKSTHNFVDWVIFLLSLLLLLHSL